MPWDCSDWTAYSHDDRTTAILETLAENRGKTLYCGIDQSDTFTKAETWEAGRDRNERDDTVYFGERGQFRGFIAAQEGWLTEGESGITGQSTASIFEFPKERRVVRRTKRFTVGSGDKDTDTCPDATPAGSLICSDWSSWPGLYTSSQTQNYQVARYTQVGISGAETNWDLDWQTGALTRRSGQTRTPAGLAALTPAQWQAWAEAAAIRNCRGRRARYVTNSANFHEGHSNNAGAGTAWHGDNLGWFFEEGRHSTQTNNFRYRARQSRTWSATCVKKVRRTRR